MEGPFSRMPVMSMLRRFGRSSGWWLAEGEAGDDAHDSQDDDAPKRGVGSSSQLQLRPLTSLRAIRAAHPRVQRAAAVFDRAVAAVDQGVAVAGRLLSRRAGPRLILVLYLLSLHLVVLWVMSSCHRSPCHPAAAGAAGLHPALAHPATGTLPVLPGQGTGTGLAATAAGGGAGAVGVQQAAAIGG
jgi:hypothetical protein